MSNKTVIGSVSLYELCRQIVNNQIHIPKSSVIESWSRDKVLKLLRSIYLDYPIGTLLFWETCTHIQCHDSIGLFKLDAKNSLSNKTYLLDGQNRLLTVINAMLSQFMKSQDLSESEDQIWFNAHEEKFEYLNLNECPPKDYHFPMYAIPETTFFINEIQRINQSKNPFYPLTNLYIDRINDLSSTFLHTYKIPTIKLRNVDFDKAMDICSSLGIETLNKNS